MRFFSKSRDPRTVKKVSNSVASNEHQPKANVGWGTYDVAQMNNNNFTGSTLAGTMPLPCAYDLDYYALRERSWQAYVENETAASFIDRLCTFTINTGLKLQYEPSKLLEFEGGLVPKELKDYVEREFSAYAGSKHATMAGDKDLHAAGYEAFMNTAVAGDILVILHIKNGEIKVQHVDGKFIVDPWDRVTQIKAIRRNNTIKDGIEYDTYGKEVACYVRQEYKLANKVSPNNFNDRLRTERIEFIGPSGRVKAFRPKRGAYRVGASRGKPILTPVMQNMELMRRYKLAELIAAEVNAQMVFAIQHDENSLMTNPLSGAGIRTGGRHAVAQELGNLTGFSTGTGDEIAGALTATTGGSAINLGRGQRLVTVDSKRPNVDGAKFLEEMEKSSASALSIPFEIARMIFNSNYSASRAALAMFEVILRLERKNFADNYYSVIASERLRYHSLTGRIKMPKEYKQAVMDRNEFVLGLYEVFRFTGTVIPHIDPMKEVKAAIMKIDNKLSTRSRESEGLDTGDYEENVERLLEETKLSKELDEMTLERESPNETDNDDGKEDD